MTPFKGYATLAYVNRQMPVRVGSYMVAHCAKNSKRARQFILWLQQTAAEFSDCRVGPFGLDPSNDAPNQQKEGK